MLIIYNVESENEKVAELPKGHHVLGRGPLLKCQDKRVSRSHASIDVKENTILTAIHINPCFYMPAGSKSVTILPKDSSTTLHDGDKFGLLPDMFWYKVQVVEDSPSKNAVQSSKRSLAESDEGETSKRARTDENEASTTTNNGEENSPSAQQVEHENQNQSQSSVAVNSEPVASTSEVVVQVKQENTSEDNSVSKCADPMDASDIKTEVKLEPMDEPCRTSEEPTSNDLSRQEPECNSSTENAATVVKTEVKTENDRNDESNAASAVDQTNESADSAKKEKDDEEKDGDCGASTSDQQPSSTTRPRRRERCWYGAGCYRQNPVHRADYCHPGDSDYESDPNDDRPTCSYGAMCYRRNKDHRAQYKHPSRAPPKANGRPKRQAQRKKKPRDPDDGSDLDEYDLEDPFIADSDEDDEYRADTDEDDDSDYEPTSQSQNAEEDSEDVQQLVKEAKRFQKQKK